MSSGKQQRGCTLCINDVDTFLLDYFKTTLGHRAILAHPMSILLPTLRSRLINFSPVGLEGFQVSGETEKVSVKAQT